MSRTVTRFTFDGAAASIRRLKKLGFQSFQCKSIRHGRVVVRAFK